MLTIKNIFSGGPILVAGPCAIESKKQLEATAKNVASAGIKFFRGGAFKLRTSPAAFQGVGARGLADMYNVCKKYGFFSVSEITSPEQIELFEKYIDIIQVGARNMYNYELLKALAKTNKPIILKRGFSATIEELIEAAGYLSKGNSNIVLCLRGIRTFECGNSIFRNTPDLASILELKEKTSLPVIFDPSHACGGAKYVIPIARAALLLGADGLLVEAHHDPAKALCDGQQCLDTGQLNRLAESFNKFVFNQSNRNG